MNGLEESFIKEVHKHFMRDKRVRKLYAQKDACQKNMQFLQAMEIAKEIDALFQETLSRYAEKAAREAMAIDMRTIDLPDADKQQINIIFLKMLMCCDIIDGAVKDMDSVLKRNREDLRYAQFDDFIQLRKMMREKLKAFSQNAIYLNTTDWGSACDDMDAMMTSKAKKLHNKYKDTNIKRGG